MRNTFLFLLFICLVTCNFQVSAQPYLDLINLRVTSSPNAGIVNQDKEKIKLTYYNVSTTLPLLFKNKSDAIILSPFFEKWQFQIVNKKQNHSYYGIILPISFLKQLSIKNSILLTGIVRTNDSSGGSEKRWQTGGAAIFNTKIKESLTLKFGLYVNKEYFGVFVMPLFGIDWQINKKDCIFGVLPGSLTYQHLISQTLAYGLAFRAQTNSYNRPASNYMRIDENQLGGFIDFYVTKNIVINAEAGHSLFRQIRENQVAPCVNGDCNTKYNDLKINDNLYGKVSLAYRISLRK